MPVHIHRRRFPHPYCSVRVGGRDYEVPIPNRSSWTANAPPRKGVNWFPSPRMKGETAELSKLMQNKREEATTPRKEVFTKKERGKSRLGRKEKAKVSARAQIIVAAVQVQVAPMPGDPLLEATAANEVIVSKSKPGENLFCHEVKKRGRPPKQLLQQ